MMTAGLLLGFLPFVNGLMAGILGGRHAGGARRALVGAAVAAIPLSMILFVILTRWAPAVAVPWVISTVVTLVLGALLGAAAAAADRIPRTAR